MEAFGIENIKKALLFSGKLSSAVAEALKDDGKIKGGEWFSIAVTIPGIVPVIKNFDTIVDEFQDLTDEEQAAVATYFAETFDIPNDELEAKIEAAFNLGLALAESIIEWTSDSNEEVKE